MAVEPQARPAASHALERARRVLARCDELARHSEEDGCLTRRYGTPALRAAQSTLVPWFAATGLTVRRDAVGNVIGRYPGLRPDAPTLLLGSHLDTVRDAGKYDGPLGILIALAGVERLHARGEPFPFAIEVAAFADEEGVRFGVPYLGSRALAGTLDDTILERRDDDGITFADAARAFAEGGGAVISARHHSSLLGYVETHIEQGPVLEQMDTPVAVVTAISGQTRATLRVVGEAGHAGTVPMASRRDALCAAAELVLAVEALARRTDGLVATVGRLGVLPGASNVLPGIVDLSLDLRHPDDAARDAAWNSIRTCAGDIAASRCIEIEWTSEAHDRSTTCDPALADLLGAAVAQSGRPAHRLPSGAGHDAVALASLCPVAMLFVRCSGGVSHHPAEAVAVADVAAAVDVQDRFLRLLAARHQEPAP